MTPSGRKILRWVIVAAVLVPMVLAGIAYRYILGGGADCAAKTGSGRDTGGGLGYWPECAC
jgi:hypothetical protein